jgi:hypothetical protein
VLTFVLYVLGGVLAGGLVGAALVRGVRLTWSR